MNSNLIQQSSRNINSNLSQSIHFEDEEIPGDNWVEKVKFAFDEVDVEGKKEITMDQWMKSRLGLIVTSEKLAGDRLQEYFYQIDSNSDKVISWDELIDYLTCQQKCINADHFDKNLNLIHVAPDLATAHKFRKNTDCLRVIYIRYIEQIVTLTESTMTFWNLDCTQNFHFTDIDGFVDFCYLSCLARIAIATKNRKIIFFDMKGKHKMPCSIKATVDDRDIPQFTLSETIDALHRFHRKSRPPLFHIPTTICSNPEQPLIYVGNQEGRIEIFHLFASLKAKHSWDSERLIVKKLHNGAINQISFLPSMSSFASCGNDGFIYIWQFDQKTKLLSVAYSFQEETKVPINKFAFDERTSSISYIMLAHYIGVWKIFSEQRIIRETPSQMMAVISNVMINEESSFIVTISDSNFISIYIPPNLELVSNWYMNYHHFLCAPSAAIYINNHLYMIGNYISCWLCQTADSAILPPHRFPIITALANDTFGRILTCDETGIIYSWNILKGNKMLTFTLTEKDAIVSCLDNDSLYRRMIIGYSNGIVRVISVNSGSVLSMTGKEPLDGGCNAAIFATILNNKYIIAANGRKTIIFFEDTPSKHFKILKHCHGHTEQISKLYNLKQLYLLSIGMGHELFLWNYKSLVPAFKYSLPNDPNVAADLPQSKKLFLVGDICGFIHIMSKKNQTPISSVNIFKMNVNSPISALASSTVSSIIGAGNREGYIKYMSFEDDNLVEQNMFCAHWDAVETLSISNKYNCIVSTGRDAEIRIWKIDPLQYIGCLGKNNKWDLNDPSTFKKMPFEIDEELFTIKETSESNAQTQLYEIDNEEEDESRRNIFLNEDTPADINDQDDDHYRPITRPELVLPSATTMMTDLEQTCLAGRSRPQMYDRLMRVKPSQTVIKGQSLMQFGDLVSDKDLDNTVKLLRQVRNMNVRRKKKKI